MFTRRFQTILAAGVIISLLGGFGIGQTVEAAPKKVLSITYGEPWKELIKPAIEDFERATGVEVDESVIPYGVDMVEKVSLDFAAGVASDIVMVDSFMIPAWAEPGYLLPLDGYLAEWPDWNQYYPGMQEIVSFKGKHYGIMLDTDVRMLWYWKPVFKKAGLPIPWKPKSWDDVLTAARTIKEKCPEVEAPFFIPMGTKWAEGTTMQGFYMVLLGADTPEGDRNRLRDWAAGKWIASSPAIEDALDFYRDVFVTYGLCTTTPHYAPDVWGKWREMMRGGKIGIGVGGSWEWAEFWPKELLPSLAEREKLLGWAPMPGSGKPGTPKIACISGGWSIGINAKVKDPDTAWEFMKILNSKERTANWLAFAGKTAVRKDAAEVGNYAANTYLMEVLDLMEYSTYRDTYPGYTTVSSYIQEATADVAVEGKTPAAAMVSFMGKMVMEFGADKVKVIR